MRQKKRKPDWQVEIAEERIDILFNLAKKNLEKHPERSRRYVDLAGKLGLRYNVRLTKKQKRSFCKNCNTILIPGKTSLVRLDSKRNTLTIKCNNCQNIYRHPYK